MKIQRRINVLNIRLFQTLCLCCLSVITSAQIEWPPITPSTKPWTRWWWQGNAVHNPDLRANMRLYHAAGLGGLEITPIYGVKGYESQFIDFLSPHWMDKLTFVLNEAKILGLGIDMATGTGWPFGGPWLGDQHTSKYFTHKVYSIAEGQRLLDTIIYHQEGFVRTANGARLQLKDLKHPVTKNINLQALAIDQIRYDTTLSLFALIAFDRMGHHLDLTHKVKQGILDWTAPVGSWDLYALFQGMHGKMVERAAPGGEGMVIDHFDDQALLHYLSKFDSAFLNKDLTYLRGFFNDSYEVDDARGQSNWTPLLFEEFKKRRGYDLLSELPALFNPTPNQHTSSILHDYRETISELILEKFTKPWARWGHDSKKLIRNQSHGSPANILDLYAAVDIPETEGNELSRFKFASSAAHVMGKPLVSAEAATWLGEHFQSSLADVKHCIDRFFLGGINHVFYHGTNYSPLKERWPGWLFYAATHFTPANPMWKDFKVLNEYVTRCQSFLQQGRSDNDILLYFPFADRNHQSGRDLLHHFDGLQGFESTVFSSTVDSLTTSGYAYDFISDRQIQSLTVQNGSLISPGGAYQTIVISGVIHMPLSTLMKLDTLRRQGALILFHHLPSKVAGYDPHLQKQIVFDSLLLNIHADQITNHYPGLLNLLSTASIRNEYGLYHRGLACIRRKTTIGKNYFIKNPSATLIEGWFHLSATDNAVLLYDPMRQRHGLGTWRPTSQGIEVWISLRAGESLILETKNSVVQGAPFQFYEPIVGHTILLDKGWNLRFLKGGPTLPPALKLNNLKDWIDLPLKDIRSFSGTAYYTISFDKPAAPFDYYELDLGMVKESAEIKLNGKIVSTCIGPHYTAVIPVTAFKSKNKLEVLVTNSMANHIIDLEQRNIPWKYFYNINMPSKLVENRGKDGLFTAAHWKPSPSGLIGPVKLYPVSIRP